VGWHDSGKLGVDFIKTVERTIYSTVIAAVIAIPLGILLGSSEKVYRSVEFLIDFSVRPRPPPCFRCFGIVRRRRPHQDFGGGVRRGAGHPVQRRLRRDECAQDANSRGKGDGASRIRVLWDVMLLESLPQTFVGLRNGVSLALVIVVVAEMFIGSTDGLGQRVFEAQQLFDMPDMYAAIFAAGALGYGLNLLFLTIERRFVHWSGK